MRIVTDPAKLQQVVSQVPRPLILVPTMGALHEGHLALVRRARRLARGTGTTAASIFVNPIQFGPSEDFGRYPRSFEQDSALLKQNGCDLVFAPGAPDMYYPDRSIEIVENSLSRVMCGASRPGHFSGVCTVVAKLFNLFRPDIAIFGAKDFQQFAIIKRMVRDLNFPIRLEAHPTVREPDGLAMSSRNIYLSAEEREQAPVIQQVLQRAEKKVREGRGSVAGVVDWMRTQIQLTPLAKVDYVVAVDPVNLQTASELRPPVLLAAAVLFGKTRLIDNRLVE
ncbi:MAG TPA: pantoate--beta-alanine ligase [Chthoniobacterales bacterium]|jgi:pantoate--beta-alanine ligase|nr:pantoate--beta-alanine ligase [Chthoniobacterales bacterium]